MTTHRITTIQELMDLATLENVDALMADVTACVQGAAALKEIGGNFAGYIEWTDDGKREITYIIEQQ